MSEIVDLQTRTASLFKQADALEFDEFLVAEGLELLAAFRSIEDDSVRKSVLLMLSRVATALKPLDIETR